MTSEKQKEIFLEKALEQIPRVLGLIDRNCNSITYGCTDRYYWHYKLHDYSNARMQEVCLLLTLLYKNNFHSLLFNNKKILDWARAAIIFWSKIRNRDGSVNEIYPYEHSFCATAMSTYAITESILLLEDFPLVELEKTAKWLMYNDNILVSNQMAAAALALYNIYLITREKEYEYASGVKINILLNNQDEDGFFREYGGRDLGYQSLTLSFLGKLYFKNNDNNLKEVIRKGLNVIENNLDDNGNFDYSKMSRRTQFLYPYSFQIVRDNNLISKIANGVKQNFIINPSWLDDRYVIPLAVDYLQTYLESRALC